jgi:CBS domain containing-hemolysin-like protein
MVVGLFHAHPRLAAVYKTILLLALFSAISAHAAGGGPPPASTAPATQADVILLVVYILLALVFSFLCSVAEAVLLSITPSFIAGLRETNPKRAELLKKLKQDNVDQSLAAILTLNTIAHTVGAIGSGAKATVVFGSKWFGLFSVVMTLLILFLSEIIPKTLGAVYWRKLAGPTAMFVRWLITMLYPLIWLSERLTKVLARGKSVHAFNREEFVALAGIGERSGHLQQHESRVLINLFQMASLKAMDIMTPRTVVVAVPETATIEEALEVRSNHVFSRLPLYGKDLDDIKGLVLKDDLLLSIAKGSGGAPVTSLQRPIMTVSRSMPISDLLEFLLDNRQHIVLAVGEYGETSGLVTLEDVVETLLGMEIVDEADTVDDMQALARQQWQKRAKALGLDVDDDKDVAEQDPQA